MQKYIADHPGEKVAIFTEDTGLLVLCKAEKVATIKPSQDDLVPLPQDETLWENLHLVFATVLGNVRRNKLSDFRNVRAAGLIAMKLDEGDSLVDVGSLALRLWVGDGLGVAEAWRVGGTLNIVAVLTFAGCAAWSAATAGRIRSSR